MLSRPRADVEVRETRLRHAVVRTVNVVASLSLTLIAIAVVCTLGLWVVTPGVGGALGRVEGVDAAHGTAPLRTLPHPDRTGRAVIASEDARFATDPGIDPVGAARVALGALHGQADVGGASIEQQLAKLLYTNDRYGLAGKAEDVVLAMKLDAHFSKSRILSMYLSAAYFGQGYYGLSAAAKGYFGASPSGLSWAQAAVLAGVLPAPSAFDPITHPAAARARQQHVIDRLVAVGVLDHQQAAAARAAPLRVR